MKKKYRKIISTFAFIVVLTLLAACGGKEFAYQESNDIKPGAGLFSGEDGVFTIYSGDLGKGDRVTGSTN